MRESGRDGILDGAAELARDDASDAAIAERSSSGSARRCTRPLPGLLPQELPAQELLAPTEIVLLRGVALGSPDLPATAAGWRASSEVRARRPSGVRGVGWARSGVVWRE